MQSPMPAEVAETLALWPLIPPGGSPLDIGRPASGPERDGLDVCETCGDTGEVYRLNAAAYADERDARMPCPACFPTELN